MKRVLYVAPTGDIGGAEVSLLSLLARLEHFAPEVVVPLEGRLSVRLRGMGVPVHVLEAPEAVRSNPFAWSWSVFRMASLCLHRRISLVHCNHEFANRRAVVAARLARIPYVCYVRNIQTAGSFRECWLGLSPVLVANSHATERSYSVELRTGQVSHVIHNGIDVSFFDGRRAPESPPYSAPGRFVIAQVGRITREKGLHVFVQALAEVAQRFDGVYGIIAGDTSVLGSQTYELELRGMASRLGLEDRLSFSGYVEDVRALYRCVDLLVQPSDCEPFGRSVLEAMAMGLPVVATCAGGVTEVVSNGETGLLVVPGSAGALAQAIMQVIENPALASRLGESGRLRAQNLFAIERHVTRLEQVYCALIGDEEGNRAA